MAKDYGPSSPPWQTGTRLMAAVLLLVFVGAVAYATRQLAPPVVLSLFLAYLLHPIVTRLERWTRMPRWLAVLIVYLVLLAMIGGATTGIGIAVSQQVVGVINDLIKISREIPLLLTELANTRIQFWIFEYDLSQVNLDPLIEQLTSTIQPLLVGTGTFIGSVAATTASLVSMLFLTLIFGFYMLVDSEKIRPAILAMIPEPYLGDFRRLLDQTGKIWQAFLRGQLILGLVIGLTVTAAMSVVGVRFALALGLISGVLEFVPIFGPIISGVIAAAVALFSGSTWLNVTPFVLAVIVGLIFLVIQQIENNVLVPKIIGTQLDLNPFVVLISVLAGGVLAGFLGVLLAAPVVASMRIWLGYIYSKAIGVEAHPVVVLKPRIRQKRRPDVARIQQWWRQWNEKRKQSRMKQEE